MGNISNRSCGENKRACFMFNNFFQKRAIYEILLKNMVQQDRPHNNKIGHMCFAHWITQTHTEYAILIAFPQ
jgi:hypothetical protein